MRKFLSLTMLSVLVTILGLASTKVNARQDAHRNPVRLARRPSARHVARDAGPQADAPVQARVRALLSRMTPWGVSMCEWM